MFILEERNFEHISLLQFNKIKEFAKKEYIYYHKKHMDSYTSFKKSYAIVRNYNPNDKTRVSYSKRELLQLTTFSLTSHIDNIVATNKYNFENDLEKYLFKINATFPDDVKFMERIQNSQSFVLLDEFLNKYLSYNSQDEKQNRIKKHTYLKLYIKKYNKEITELVQYFNKFHGISDFELILNRLFQLYYTNNELYNKNKVENKKLIK